MKKKFTLEVFDCSFSKTRPPRCARVTELTIYELPHAIKINMDVAKALVDLVVFSQTDNLTVQTDTFRYVITKE